MAMEKSEKTKAVEAALLNIEKQFGKGAIMRLGDHRSEDVPVISTSSIGLDAAIGVGGFPRGRVIEIFGPESSGKTTLALHVVAQAQKAGGIAAYIDAEHALDAIYAEKLGVNINDLFVSQPDSGEQALEIAESLVRSNAVDALVIDSVAALTPRAELEGDMGDSLPGLQARLMSQALRKLTAVVGRSNTCLIFINQIREKIGVMFGCFHYDTRVVLADGTTEKIGKIVNQRTPVEVLSFNAQTGAIEPRRVVNWFNNGPADYFLQFEVEGGPSGRRCFGVTPNHNIFTPNGEVAAGDLRVGDEVLSMPDDWRTDDSIMALLSHSVGSLGRGFRLGRKPEIDNLRSRGTTMETQPFRYPVTARISKIYFKRPTRTMDRFDLEIEGNHSYMVDGVIVHNSPETTTGGRALKFYSTLRLDIRRITQIKDGENVIGNRTKVKVVKNKVAPPFREAEFDIVYGEGISKLGELIDIGVENKIVDKAGAWFSYKGERLGQGRDNAKNTLRDNVAMRDKIEAEVRAALGIGKPQATAAPAAAEAAPAP
ncbi:MAG: recombinase RecA, partial [Chloracidobacterium sp.]|nr:recombinase RecA [Chloracidobacterium sp.]